MSTLPVRFLVQRWRTLGVKPYEQTSTSTSSQRERKKERESETIAAVLKEALTLSKQHYTSSTSALYQCIHGNWLFCHLKICHCLRRFSFEDREWGASRGGGRLHANDAIANLQAKPTFFFFLSLLSQRDGGGLSCAPSFPTCRQNIPCPSHIMFPPASSVNNRVWINIYSAPFFRELICWSVSKMPPLLKWKSPEGNITLHVIFA